MKALVLGGVSWNHMVHLGALPDARPQTLFARSSYETVGSSGAGKALNLGGLGWDVTLWALIGADDAGDRVREHLRTEGIDLLTDLDPAGTMRHVNLMDPNGDRISIFANPGTLDLEVEHRAILERAGDADLVAVTIFEHCRGFLAHLGEAGVEVWIDVHDFDGVNPYHTDFVEAASYLQLSSIGMNGWRAFAEARITSGTKVVLCTHGAKGASILTDRGWVEIPAEPVETIVDSNGAGDAFFAGFATAWMSGLGVEAAGRLAASTAAAAVLSPDLAPRSDRSPGAGRPGR